MRRPLRERMIDPLPEPSLDRLWQQIAARQVRGRARVRAPRWAVAGVVVAASLGAFGALAWKRPLSTAPGAEGGRIEPAPLRGCPRGHEEPASGRE